MRPRRIRRGWPPTQAPGSFCPIKRGRFNEAPANSPGMGGRRAFGSLDGRAEASFNEAPANSPGMDTLHRRADSLNVPGFNEAPANSPGMGRCAEAALR